MSKKYLIKLIKMSDDALNVELENITTTEFRAALRLALKEQDRDTRHACAEACIVNKDFHNACMNCDTGLEVI